MAVVDGRTWTEHLSAQDCWELLAGTVVGRIAVLVDGAPIIFPVNFAVDRRSIVFRTDPGNKLRSLGHEPSVCFEADAIDVGAKTGWSVLVRGRAGEVTAAGELTELSRLPLEYWTTGPKSHWIRIVAHEVTGRRVHPVVPRR